MAGIDELVGGSQGPHRNPFNAVEAARVASVAGSEVRLTVKSFSNDLVFAVVPFIKKGTGEPSAGDPAVLHSDSDGHPIYAVVLS